MGHCLRGGAISRAELATSAWTSVACWGYNRGDGRDGLDVATLGTRAEPRRSNGNLVEPALSARCLSTCESVTAS